MRVAQARVHHRIDGLAVRTDLGLAAGGGVDGVAVRVDQVAVLVVLVSAVVLNHGLAAVAVGDLHLVDHAARIGCDGDLRVALGVAGVAARLLDVAAVADGRAPAGAAVGRVRVGVAGDGRIVGRLGVAADQLLAEGCRHAHVAVHGKQLKKAVAVLHAAVGDGRTGQDVGLADGRAVHQDVLHPVPIERRDGEFLGLVLLHQHAVGRRDGAVQRASHRHGHELVHARALVGEHGVQRMRFLHLGEDVLVVHDVLRRDVVAVDLHVGQLVAVVRHEGEAGVLAVGHLDGALGGHAAVHGGRGHDVVRQHAGAALARAQLLEGDDDVLVLRHVEQRVGGTGEAAPAGHAVDGDVVHLVARVGHDGDGLASARGHGHGTCRRHGAVAVGAHEHRVVVFEVDRLLLLELGGHGGVGRDVRQAQGAVLHAAGAVDAVHRHALELVAAVGQKRQLDAAAVGDRRARRQHYAAAVGGGRGDVPVLHLGARGRQVVARVGGAQLVCVAEFHVDRGVLVDGAQVERHGRAVDAADHGRAVHVDRLDLLACVGNQRDRLLHAVDHQRRAGGRRGAGTAGIHRQRAVLRLHRLHEVDVDGGVLADLRQLDGIAQHGHLDAVHLGHGMVAGLGLRGDGQAAAVDHGDGARGRNLAVVALQDGDVPRLGLGRLRLAFAQLREHGLDGAVLLDAGKGEHVAGHGGGLAVQIHRVQLPAVGGEEVERLVLAVLHLHGAGRVADLQHAGRDVAVARHGKRNLLQVGLLG